MHLITYLKRLKIIAFTTILSILFVLNFENVSFAAGTKAVAIKLVEISQLNATVIAGGGDTASALRHFNMVDKVTHVSTGGGASLELMSGNQLKAINKLEI